MALRTYLGSLTSGTEIVDRVRLGDVDGFEQKAWLGEASVCDIKIDDPDGDLDLTGWQPIYFIEDTAPAGDQRIATYYLDTRKVDRERPSFEVEEQRLYTTSLVEINTVSTFRVFRTGGAERPAETNIARLRWLLGTPAFDFVHDFGLVDDSDPRPMEAASYVGMRAADVMNDIASCKFGFNWWIEWDEDEEAFSLFFGAVDATTKTSDLSLSNVRADVEADPDHVFYAEKQERLERDPSDVYDGVLVRYANEKKLYLRREETTDEFGIHRDGVYDNERIGLDSTATSLGNQWLVKHSEEEDTIFATVELPAALVNGIRQGMRISVRFEHFPGYETATYVRVVTRNVRQSRTTHEYYQLDLELTRSAPSIPGGGGGPPTTPWVPCPPTPPAEPTILGIRRYVKVLGGSTLHTFTWADAVDLDGNPVPGDPIEGNDFICAAVWRNPGESYRLGEIGFSIDVTAITQGDHMPLESDVAIGRRTVGPLDTESQAWDGGSHVNWTHPISSQVSVIFELDAAAVLGATSDSGPTQHGSLLTTGSSDSPVAGLKFGAARVGSADFSSAAIITPEAGVTTIAQYGPGPDGWIAYRGGSGATDDISASAIFGDFLRDWHGGASAVYTPADETEEPPEEVPCPPPVAGQPVGKLEIAVDNCSLMGYTVPTGSYRPGSLKVWIRTGPSVLVPVLFSEADPATGVFRLFESPCDLVPGTTVQMRIFDATAGEWKYMFMEDGTPMVMTIPSSASGIPSLVVEYVQGATSTGGTPTEPPIPTEPPPAVPPSTVTDVYPGTPTLGIDHTSAIEAWIAATGGPGKVLGFTEGSYRVDGRIFVDSIDHLSLVMTNVTFRRMTTSVVGDAILTFWSCDDLAIYNPRIIGPATSSDVRTAVTYPGSHEAEHGIELVDCHGFTISHPTITNVWGDFIYYARIGAGGPETLCEDGIIDTLYGRTSGRNGVSHISGRRIRIVDMDVDELSLHGFDVEGNQSDDVCEDVTITGAATRIGEVGVGEGSHGVFGYSVQIGPGFGGNIPTRVLVGLASMEVGSVYVAGPSSGSPAQDITFRENSADASGTVNVVHVHNWVNLSNSGFPSLPASGNIT